MFNTSNDLAIEGVRKTVKVNSIFNTEDVLEFHFGPDKRSLHLAECTISFSCIIPSNFIADNGFCSKSKIYKILLINLIIMTHFYSV